MDSIINKTEGESPAAPAIGQSANMTNMPPFSTHFGISTPVPTGQMPKPTQSAEQDESSGEEDEEGPASTVHRRHRRRHVRGTPYGRTSDSGPVSGTGRRLGSFNPEQPIETIQTEVASTRQVESQAQAHAVMLRDAADRRRVIAEATARRFAVLSGQAAIAGPSISTSRTSSTTRTAAPAINSGHILQSQEPAASAPTADAPLNPLSAMMAERSARFVYEQEEREQIERVNEKVRQAEKAAKREAALTPKEKFERKIKQDAMLEVKKAQQLAAAERERVKRHGEDMKKDRQDKFERERENRNLIKAKEDAKAKAVQEARAKALKEIQAEDMAREEKCKRDELARQAVKVVKDRLMKEALDRTMDEMDEEEFEKGEADFDEGDDMEFELEGEEE